jgi:hypothetical protein
MAGIHTTSDKTFPFLLDSSEIAALGKKRLSEFVQAQTELLDEMQEANRHWLDRIQSEADLASEFATKLSAARTVPDAVAASRDWATQYFAMLAEDGRHLADDARRFIEKGARLFASGLSTERPIAAAA